MKKQILVVDDELSILKLLNFILSKDYDLVIKQNGADAISWLEDGNDPALIISDLEMPFVDGYQLATWVRENAVHCVTPIMALTAHAFEQTRIRCEEHGINEILTKPFHEKNLFDAIKRLLTLTNVDCYRRVCGIVGKGVCDGIVAAQSQGKAAGAYNAV